VQRQSARSSTFDVETKIVREFHMSLNVCISHTLGITPTTAGGIGSVISNIVNKTKDEINYTLLTTYDYRDDVEARVVYGSKAHIVRLNASNARMRNVFLDSLAYLLRAPTSMIDIVHFHDLPFGRNLPYAAKLHAKGVKMVFSYHYNRETTKYFPMNHRVGIGYYRFFFKHSSRIWEKIVVNSKYMLDDLKCHGNFSSKAIVIPNGVDIEAHQAASLITLAGNPSFLYAGHMEPHKGVDILLGAFKQLSKKQGFENAHLHLVGSGSMEPEYKKRVQMENLHMRVHFWGARSQGLVSRLMKSCDIFVLPSRQEASPIVLLEAMAAERPIISTNIGGIPEMLKHGRNALLIRPEQSKLAAAMEALGGNENLMKVFSRNNKNDVQAFSWDNIAKAYVRLYRSIAEVA
jgi:glycosyltransferase involved in cell wall biosynthesis